MHSAELYRELERSSTPGWVESGSLRLASRPERLEEIRRQHGWAQRAGLPLELISADEARELFPLMSTDGVLGAAYTPTDGQVDPARLCTRWPRSARAGGVTDRAAAPGSSGSHRRRPHGRRVSRGPHRPAATSSARSWSTAAACSPPRSPRLVGRPGAGGADVAPVRRHRAAARGLAAGGPAAAVAARPGPARLLPAGDRRAGDGRLRAASQRPVTVAARPRRRPGRTSTASCSRRTGTGSPRSWRTPQVRVPVLADTGVASMINGPEAFTPDNEFCLGETEVAGFFVAAGFCAHGIAGRGRRSGR